MKSCIVIDYGSGNLRSVAKAIERAANNRGIELNVITSTEINKIKKADYIILPGVGAFKDCKAGLLSVDDLIPTLEDEVIRKQKPFLGICVGMQLLATEGHEHEITSGLNWIKAKVKRLKPSNNELKIPHMGWNTLDLTQRHPIFRGINYGPNGDHAYFVHSYALECDHPNELLAITNYGGPITAVVSKDNILGTQFHPEKSQNLGLTFLGNFLEWKP